MTPLNLRQEDLDLGGIASMAISPDGQRIYLGRRVSGDQARENVAVLTLDPQSGAVVAKRLYRDSPDPLPPAFTQFANVPPPKRPPSTVEEV